MSWAQHGSGPLHVYLVNKTKHYVSTLSAVLSVVLRKYGVAKWEREFWASMVLKVKVLCILSQTMLGD